MSSLNRVTLIGHLGNDPEQRTTQAGDPIVTFSLATAQSWKDAASGEKRERTEWHRVVVLPAFEGQILLLDRPSDPPSSSS